MYETYNDKLKSFFIEKNNFTYTDVSFSVEHIRDNLKTQLKDLKIPNSSGSLFEINANSLSTLLQKVIDSSKEKHNKILGILQVFYLAIRSQNENFLLEFSSHEDGLFNTWGTYMLQDSTLKLLDFNVFKDAISRKRITIIVLEPKMRQYQIEVIDSVNQLLALFESFIDKEKSSETDLKYFYRGHSDSTYTNTPGVFRGGNIRYEKKFYQELLLRKTSYFYNCRTVLDHLSLMQHYGLPTRLLDLTTNPLIALYFACDKYDDKCGELMVFREPGDNIKYDDSHSVKIASCTALLKPSEKKAFLQSIPSQHGPIINIIKKEEQSFEDTIDDDKLSEVYIVKVNYGDNVRVESQSGIYAISANHETFEDQINTKRNSNISYLIPSVSKKTILKELNRLSINQFTVYTSMQDTAEHLTNYIASI